jgi:hypothetical protein
MSQTTYLVSCEVLCGEGSDGALEGMERAFVIVGVNAASEDEAMSRIEESFEEEGYAFADVEWISVASEVEWEDADSEAEGMDILARLATVPEEVVYGVLFASAGEGVSVAA